MGVQIPNAELYISDIRSWEVLLDAFSRENTLLKNTLAQVVDRIDDQPYLEMAEKFNNLFITKDECILDLRKEIESHRMALESGLYLYPAHNRKFMSRHRKLSNEMENFKSGIFQLKERFNNYLTSQ